MAGRFELFKGRDDQFYFRLKAASGETILASEGYTTKQSAENGIVAVRRVARYAERFERKQTVSGHSYLLKAPNGEVVGHSEVYRSTAARDDAITAVRTSAIGAVVDDLT